MNDQLTIFCKNLGIDPGRVEQRTKKPACDYIFTEDAKEIGLGIKTLGFEKQFHREWDAFYKNWKEKENAELPTFVVALQNRGAAYPSQYRILVIGAHCHASPGWDEIK